MDTKEIYTALSQFVIDALRDQDKIKGHTMEVVPISNSLTHIKVWSDDRNQPAATFSVKVTRHQ